MEEEGKGCGLPPPPSPRFSPLFVFVVGFLKGEENDTADDGEDDPEEAEEAGHHKRTEEEGGGGRCEERGIGWMRK